MDRSSGPWSHFRFALLETRLSHRRSPDSFITALQIKALATESRVRTPPKVRLSSFAYKLTLSSSPRGYTTMSGLLRFLARRITCHVPDPRRCSFVLFGNAITS